jgi:hypothetical protein
MTKNTVIANHAAALTIANKTARKNETRTINQMIDDCGMLIGDGFTDAELRGQGYSLLVIETARARYY